MTARRTGNGVAARQAHGAMAAAYASESRQKGVRSDAGPNRWEIYLPGMLGPSRTREKKVAGHVIKTRIRQPELPPSPNDRIHWRQLGPITKGWRDAACEAARGIPEQARIRISAVLYRRALGVSDADNDMARLKPVADGLRDAGVIANDTRGYVEWGPVTEERGTPGVLLIVEATA